MAEKILGLDFDVHGGGIDLVFPHHENEIAQTEAGRRRPLARIWMHNGMIRFGEEKMAKSVGNVRTLADALDEHGRDALIMFFLSGHYRQPLSYGPETIEQAERALERVRNFCLLVERTDPAAVAGEPEGVTAGLRDRFFAALREDFHTPRALSALFELIAEGNRTLEAGEPLPGAGAALTEMLSVLGLESLLEPGAAADPEAERLAAQREQARRDRDFARADQLRDELAERGYEVRDTPGGPMLVRVAAR
jgi:cysteinyl-tRNA synthetase